MFDYIMNAAIVGLIAGAAYLIGVISGYNKGMDDCLKTTGKIISDMIEQIERSRKEQPMNDRRIAKDTNVPSTIPEDK